jgi:hypothetical protein
LPRRPVARSPAWTIAVSGGYVAAGRIGYADGVGHVGSAVVVLRWLGPGSPEQVAVTLRTALAKARRLLG